MYPTLSPKLSRVKNDLYQDAVDRQNSQTWQLALEAARNRAHASAEIALQQLGRIVEIDGKAAAYNKLHAACLAAENEQLRQMGAVKYLNL